MSGVREKVADAELADSEVIAASLDDAERFATVFDRYWWDLYDYVARRLGPDHADDVTAEVFLAAFRVRDRYDSARRNARPWLYGIASNLVGRHRRAEQRQLRLLASVGLDEPVASFEERSDSRVEAGRLRPSLASMLTDLRPADRDLLLLIAWADLTYEQAADALGIRVGTVRSRLSRLRNRARKTLQELHIGETS